MAELQLCRHPVHRSRWDRRLGHADYLVHCELNPDRDFPWGVYDAFVRGGDVRSLGITMLKYAAVALVLMNWAAAFRDVVKSFDYVSNYIYGTSGLGDVISMPGLMASLRLGATDGDLSMLNAHTEAESRR